MSLSSSAADLLEDAGELIGRTGWCRDFLFTGEFGDSQEARHCAIGALLSVKGGQKRVSRWDPAAKEEDVLAAIAALAGVVKNETTLFRGDQWSQVASWNNNVAASADDVIEAMKQASKELRNEATP